MILDIYDDLPARRKIGKAEKEFLYQKQKGKCNYCGVKMDMPYFDIDHKTPWARDGSDSISNLQLLCGPCNKRKSDMTDGEFRRQYKLSPARQANGPPTKAIPQKYFEEISRILSAKRAKRRSRETDDLFWW